MYLFDLALGHSHGLVLAITIATGLARTTAPPPHGRIVVTETETTILDVVEFVPGTATLRPTSRPILEAVAATLDGNPSIELIEVQSHTRGAGADAAADLTLSQRRAAVVLTYLVDAGVARSRLVAHGYGDTQPIDRAAPDKNERMSFLILRRTADPGDEPLTSR